MFRRSHRGGLAAADPSVPAVPIVVHVDGGDSPLPLDAERYGSLMSAVLADEGVGGPGEANLLFVDRATMTRLNRAHMGGDGPTDVLSFPIDAAEALAGVEERMVGDVVVCPEVAGANAADHAGHPRDELALLVVHGTLHLVGHDHARPDERDRMWTRERELMARHWSPLTRDPWS